MARHSWLRTFLPRPRASSQLICFPHAGGVASTFRDWAELLPVSVELLAVQYPGRQDRIDDPMPPDIATLADEIRGAVVPLLGRPTTFFGHSMGSTVAFEVARRLRPHYPSRLERLVVSACDAPVAHRPRGLDGGDEKIRDHVRTLGGTAATVLDDTDLWRLAMRALRHDFALVESYRYVPGAPLTCPVTAVAGSRDAAVTIDDVVRWRELTIGPFDAHVLPGGHFYFDGALPDLIRLLADRTPERIDRGC
ncbi:alpha/beta fold hydrolase [Frankia sp. AgPm24]|uniref:thioesterase II family protein n=1 Tax=Frankia sp. AgPm24 TaxID=631128 RepID=UPI00200D4B64|nr:alpha/beta fold hydrolase [Frankia sp. AgPm24]MCK9922445.1 alpha/beta fold hydrolase [Frankia sp. AgPm24]